MNPGYVWQEWINSFGGFQAGAAYISGNDEPGLSRRFRRIGAGFIADHLIPVYYQAVEQEERQRCSPRRVRGGVLQPRSTAWRRRR